MKIRLINRVFMSLFLVAIFSSSLYATAAYSMALGDVVKAENINATDNRDSLATLNNIRFSDGKERFRLVLDVSRAVEYKVLWEKENTRIVINLHGIKSNCQLPTIKSNIIKDAILGMYGRDTVQLILDLKGPFPHKIFTLKNPQRIILDIQKEYEEENMTEVEPGLIYGEYRRADANGHVSAYLLEVDPEKYQLSLALAGGSISAGRRTLSAIARDNKAIAAINGGYFDLDGTLLGNTKIDGKMAGTTYFSRTAIGFFPQGRLAFNRSDYYGAVKAQGRTLFISGINCPRGENGVIIYNSLFGARTRTNEFGQEYVIRNGIVTDISPMNTIIPNNGVVLSLHGTAKEALKNLKKGDRVNIEEGLGDFFAEAETVVGAGPELLRKGKVNITAVEEKFPKDIAVGRAPRTAMGVKKNGHILFLVIDGRQASSQGTTLGETAFLLQRFGAVDAFNLDGGGSSELVVKGEIKNSPSDGKERPVASAFVLLKK